MKKIYICLITLIIFTGCSVKTKHVQFEPSIPNETPKDLLKYPQNAKFYIKNLRNTPFFNSEKRSSIFLALYFNPWNKNFSFPITKEQAQWGNLYKNQPMYGENYQLIGKSWFEKMAKYGNFDEYNSIKKRAITVAKTNLRVFPTDKPMMKEFFRAGEGFPFDYNQNSSVKLNTPLYVSHFTKDRAWAFVTTPTITGWINTKDIAYVDNKFIKNFIGQGQYSISIKDNLPIYSQGLFQEHISLATIFPVFKDGKFIIAKKDKNHQAYITLVDKTEHIVPFPLNFDERNVELVTNELLGERYGWGGLFDNRDCSLLTQDFYKMFATLLNRNSVAQKENGTYIDMKKLTNNEKILLIKKAGIPFQTLFSFPQHVGIYLGTFNDVPVFLHDIWGLKTKDEDGIPGRILIGKSIISSLTIGNEFNNINEDELLIEKIEGMINLNN